MLQMIQVEISKAYSKYCKVQQAITEGENTSTSLLTNYEYTRKSKVFMKNTD